MTQKFVLGTTQTVHSVKWFMTGDSGVGKTSLTLTLPVEQDAQLFYINADPGELALRKRAFTKASAPFGLWSEEVLNNIYDYLHANHTKYKFVAIDGVDELGSAILRARKAVNKDGRKAYGELNDFMEPWIKRMRDLPDMTTLFITHLDARQDDSGAIEYLPSFPGKSFSPNLKKWFDLMGVMRFIKQDDGTVKRLIQFRPELDLKYKEVTKDRADVTVGFEEPDLGRIMTRIQDAGFTVSEEEKEEATPVTQLDLDWLASWCESNKVGREAVRKLASDMYPGEVVGGFSKLQFRLLKERLPLLIVEKQ